MDRAQPTSMTNINSISTVNNSMGPTFLNSPPHDFSQFVIRNSVLSEVAEGKNVLQQTPGKVDGVQIVQSYLKTLGHAVSVNGIFDEKTRLVIKHIQRAAGFPPTGIVDRQTLEKIDKSLKDLPSGLKNAERFLQEYNIAQSTSLQVKIFPKLEHGQLSDVKAIVLHRTGSSSAQSTFSHYAQQSLGAHYLIDTDGTIYQTAGLGKKTAHVGEIKSKCFAKTSCETAEQNLLQTLQRLTGGRKKHAVHDLEKNKHYPDRYPMNEDSIGIEVVGMYNEQTGYGPPTDEQLESVKKLVEVLKEQFSLTNDDVYAHTLIATKDEKNTEGLFLGY